MLKNKVEIYSDGSGNSLGSDGGWGCVVVVNGTKVDESSGFMDNATNNTAELTAAIRGISLACHSIALLGVFLSDCEFTLVSDSQLVLNYATGNWKCRKEHLMPFCAELQHYTLMYDIKTRWVKGHSGDEHNERCDELAGEARIRGRKRRAAINFIKTLIRFKIFKLKSRDMSDLVDNLTR